MNKLNFWKKMAGKYANKEKIKDRLQLWLGSINSNIASWEANNIHIDEIPTFTHIKRHEWINASFTVFDILSQLELANPLLIFLHINLSDSKTKFKLNNFSLDWLNNNLHEFTPPSFNCTTINYYKEFYQKNLIKCNPDNIFLKLINTNMNLSFFYRTNFDKLEGLYLRELYIFKTDQIFLLSNLHERTDEKNQ